MTCVMVKFQPKAGGYVKKLRLTAGAVVTAGDLVALQTDDDKVDPVAPAGAAALGWAMNGAVDGDPLDVADGRSCTAVMPYSNAYTAGELGGFYNLAGLTGVQTVDLDSVAGNPVLCLEEVVDATNKLCRVSIRQEKQQFGGVVV